MANFISNEDRITRLQIASDRVGGDAPLGRLLGYKDGAFIGQMLRGEKPITEKTIKKILQHRKISDLFTWNVHTGFDTSSNDESANPVEMIGSASMSFSAKGTMTAAVTLEDALAEVAKTMLMADDLAKIQAKPLLAHLIENPDQADKIIPRLVALLDGEPLTTETKDFAHAKQPS